MSRVTVYSKASCPICERAKNMLHKWNIEFSEIAIDTDVSARCEFAEVTHGARTVPQVLIDGKCIGGFSELTELHMDGDLDNLMQSAQ
ncbi:MAG: glutaredoxin [Gammaproteobacteria bacterium]|nr:glutaredoxin [Gammaproteobacteria bacterium]